MTALFVASKEIYIKFPQLPDKFAGHFFPNYNN